LKASIFALIAPLQAGTKQEQILKADLNRPLSQMLAEGESRCFALGAFAR